jgi:hypothetical protein
MRNTSNTEICKSSKPYRGKTSETNKTRNNGKTNNRKGEDDTYAYDHIDIDACRE